MTAIHLFFEQNEPIILFGYGLVFFIMGLAIALQSRQSSRLELARSLAWLAAFGILHSLYEWGELFSPVQEAYLSPRNIAILHNLHLLSLSLSFACLLQFAVALFRPLQRAQWLQPLTVGLISGYIIAIFWAFPRFIPDPIIRHDAANALARYMLGFPGALASAYALRAHTFRFIAPFNAPYIFSNLLAAGLSLVSYAIFGGLIPPPVFFFPGNVLNTNTFEHLVGVPPLVFQALTGFVLAITVIRALEIFQVETERRIERMEQDQILAAERSRLARELHDRTIQTAYTAGLLVDSARKLAEPESSIATRLDRAVMALDEVIQDLRYNLGELKGTTSHQSLGETLSHLAEDPRFRSLVDVRLDLQLPPSDSFSSAGIDHVVAIIGEAMANIVRHSRATDVSISAQVLDDRLKLTIQDNGLGLPQKLEPGYGLRNMMERARLLGGTLEVESDRGRGTVVHLDIPWQEERKQVAELSD